MAISGPRYKILPLRGTFAALNAEVPNIFEGEICYALDEDQYYQKEGGVLVAVGATKAQGALADSAIQPLDNVSELTNDAAYVDAAGASAAAPVQSVAGKTGAVSLVKGDVGLGNVDNTSDANKPVSAAQQTALNTKADLASPALTGTPTAPTATVGTSTTQLATTAFVTTAVAAAVTPPADASETVKGIVELATATETTAGTDNTRAVHPAGLKVELDKKANQTSTYSKTEVDGALALKADQATTYTKTETDDALALKANQASTYTKAEVDQKLVTKANQATTYTKSETDQKLALKANLNNPALTGVPTAPTAAAGTNTTQVATTAFVTAAIDNTSLPGQIQSLEPINIINPSSGTEATRRNLIEKNGLWTGSFTIPDGATDAVVIMRCRVFIRALQTDTITSGNSYAVIWCEGIGFEVESMTNVTFLQTPSVEVEGLSVSPVDGRYNGTILMRMNDVSFNAGTNRTANYSVKGFCQDSQGTGAGQLGWGSLQMLIQPYAKNP